MCVCLSVCEPRLRVFMGMFAKRISSRVQINMHPLRWRGPTPKQKGSRQPSENRQIHPAVSRPATHPIYPSQFVFSRAPRHQSTRPTPGPGWSSELFFLYVCVFLLVRFRFVGAPARTHICFGILVHRHLGAERTRIRNCIRIHQIKSKSVDIH